ncbi:hypothetical protein CEUSTIGMA_g10190.t1 [Chlamydomonas eustigma]|uniref:ADP-ribosylglycohydrolase n=1 Tax=Chlamydomonas eustigma TaxID=1157962 RepID=A0A250XI59_9CHLO|nr:hypothetical protein CEUSTIGMA_g10190.t1 [Chlamydomonas eustigma]|eukprot:GAX82764.1 hypothetical protein CEUSTIGMA_g10190.t1 [Chlamydomonas eustigma]
MFNNVVSNKLIKVTCDVMTKRRDWELVKAKMEIVVVFLIVILSIAFIIYQGPSYSNPNYLAASNDGLDRARAALLGAFVADAATMGLHWVYNQTELHMMLEARGIQEWPEFMTPPASKYYEYESGRFSPYGDELLPMLKFLAEQGHMDEVKWTRYLAFYYMSYRGRLNKSSKSMVEAYNAGKLWPETGKADDSQANALVKVPAIVARYAGRPGLVSAIEVAVRAQQNNDLAVEAAIAIGKVLERVVLGSTVPEAVNWALTSRGLPASMQLHIQHAMSQTSAELNEVVVANGMSCQLPAAMINVLVTALKYSSYPAALRANMVAGGDSCSRGIIIGALLAAQDGTESIPQNWKTHTTQFEEITSLTNQLLMWRGVTRD